VLALFFSYNIHILIHILNIGKVATCSFGSHVFAVIWSIALPLSPLHERPFTYVYCSSLQKVTAACERACAGIFVPPNPRFLCAHSSRRPSSEACGGGGVFHRSHTNLLVLVLACLAPAGVPVPCPCGCGGRTLSDLGKARGHRGPAEAGVPPRFSPIGRCPARCRGSTRLMTAASLIGWSLRNAVARCAYCLPLETGE
jgi:hypothetical protein